MTRRAVFSPGPRSKWSQNLLVALGMGAAVVLLGCGGGGGGGGINPPGGGPGADACQDNTAGTTAVCGYVLQDGTTNGVNGATVAVKTATGTIVSSIKTYHNATTGKDGYFVLPVGTGKLIGVAPPASGYLQSYFRFVSVYDINRTVLSGGPCNPALPNLPTQNGGNIITSFFLFPDSATPPPPVFNCPRQ